MKQKLEYLKENLGNLNASTSNQLMLELLELLINPSLNVNFAKIHPKAKLPSYSKNGDAGLDLTAVDMKYVRDAETDYYEYDTGLSCEIPQGYVGLIFPRSSITKTDLILSNCVGVVDSGYRGKITARFRKTTGSPHIYQVGDRVCQMIILPYPKVSTREVDYTELSQTERGTGGWGSTGR